MKAKIDLEKFICSYIKWNNIQDALKDQGLKCWNDEIVEIPQESEDERIREAQLDYWRSVGGKEWQGIPVQETITWLEKQGEQKLADKVEPKFKVGDWIVSPVLGTAHIIGVNDSNEYQLEYIDGKQKFSSIDYVNYEYDEWTIQDAEDGDVLWHSDTASNGIFIFKEIRHDGKVLCYCDYDSEDHFCTGEYHTCCWSNDKSIKPATKEQRDHLFGKMKEAGYIWDDEKELRKIEKHPADKVESNFHEGDWVVYKNDICQIVKREEGCNKLVTVFGIEKEIVNERNLSTARLWTIEDAKEGDILTNQANDVILIFKTIQNNYLFSSYCDYFVNTFREKQFSQWASSAFIPATKEQRDHLFVKMKEAGYEWDAEKKELRKIEQKPADKVEPQFHEGDWITDGQLICKILGVTGKSYELHLYNDDYCHFNTDIQSVNKYYHLWTIQDAKDGDVLLSKHNQPFIYNGIFDEESVGAYCGIDCLGDDFLKDSFSCNWSYKEGVKPTTKEQRVLLFKKMYEAGYEWDAEKKELRKLEKQSVQKPTLRERYKNIAKSGWFKKNHEGMSCGMISPEESLGISSDEYNEIVNNCIFGEHDDTRKTKEIMGNEQKLSFNWTENDEKNWIGIIDEIKANKNEAPDYDIETYNNFLSWLNNIKQRMKEQNLVE